nr:unnamed protein product [Digitaria exilis]
MDRKGASDPPRAGKAHGHGPYLLVVWSGPPKSAHGSDSFPGLLAPRRPQGEAQGTAARERPTTTAPPRGESPSRSRAPHAVERESPSRSRVSLALERESPSCCRTGLEDSTPDAINAGHDRTLRFATPQMGHRSPPTEPGTVSLNRTLPYHGANNSTTGLPPEHDARPRRRTPEERQKRHDTISTLDQHPSKQRLANEKSAMATFMPTVHGMAPQINPCVPSLIDQIRHPTIAGTSHSNSTINSNLRSRKHKLISSHNLLRHPKHKLISSHNLLRHPLFPVTRSHTQNSNPEHLQNKDGETEGQQPQIDEQHHRSKNYSVLEEEKEEEERRRAPVAGGDECEWRESGGEWRETDAFRLPRARALHHASLAGEERSSWPFPSAWPGDAFCTRGAWLGGWTRLPNTRCLHASGLGSPSTANGTVLAMVRYLSAYSISRYRLVSRLSRLETYFQNPYTPVRVISLSE